MILLFKISNLNYEAIIKVNGMKFNCKSDTKKTVLIQYVLNDPQKRVIC